MQSFWTKLLGQPICGVHVGEKGAVVNIGAPFLLLFYTLLIFQFRCLSSFCFTALQMSRQMLPLNRIQWKACSWVPQCCTDLHLKTNLHQCQNFHCSHTHDNNKKNVYQGSANTTARLKPCLAYIQYLNLKDRSRKRCEWWLSRIFHRTK